MGKEKKQLSEKSALAKKRSKLNKGYTKGVSVSLQELLTPIDERVKSFVKRLRGVRAKNDIRRICLGEKKSLEKLYPNINTQHKYYTKYRNAIKKQYPAMKKDPQGRLVCKHYSLIVMKLDYQKNMQRNLNMGVNLDKKASNVASFDLREMIDKCRHAVRDLKDPHIVAIGLMGLTGRRPIEILKTGRFEYVDKSHVVFSGQAKTKAADSGQDNYRIPVLDDSKVIVRALAFIRDKLDLQSVNNEYINGSATRSILDKAKRFFKNVRTTEHIKFNNKSLRSMYVSSLYELLNIKEKMSFNAYAAKVLGHSELDKSTANSYTYYSVQLKRDVNNYEFKDLLLSED